MVFVYQNAVDTVRSLYGSQQSNIHTRIGRALIKNMTAAVPFSGDDDTLPPRPIPTLLPRPLEDANSSPALHPHVQID